MRTLRGTPAAPGLGVGPAHVLHAIPPVDPEARRSGSAAAEDERLDAAIARAVARLDALIGGAHGPAAEILAAQQELLADPELRHGAASLIETGLTAEAAVTRVAAGYADELAALPDPTLAARAADVREAGRRIVAALRRRDDGLRIERPVVLVAQDLSPAEALQVDPALLRGVVTAGGSAGGHLAIVAQGLGVPAVVGVADLLSAVTPGAMVVVDGDAGDVTLDPDAATLDAAEGRAAALRRMAAELAAYSARPGQTRDGVPVAVFANIGSVSEAEQARAAGAAGVGLFRTELLAGLGLPSEEAQYEVYRAAAAAIGGPLVVRTFDIGGDKPVPGLAIPPEPNPFLGWRGIRLALDRPAELFLPQVRALLRAAAEHDVRIMLPMVVSPDEVDAARALIEQAVQVLERAGRPWRRAPLGIMVETPAAALTLDTFVGRVDFASLGTNDLLQYTYAADRTNARVADRALPLGLALLRLVERACAAGIPLAVCGRLAADPAAIPILVGLGVREVSVPPARVAAIKRALAAQTLAEMQAAARGALGPAAAGSPAPPGGPPSSA